MKMFVTSAGPTKLCLAFCVAMAVALPAQAFVSVPEPTPEPEPTPKNEIREEEDHPRQFRDISSTVAPVGMVLDDSFCIGDKLNPCPDARAPAN